MTISLLGFLPEAHIQPMESGVLLRFLHCRGSGRRRDGWGGWIFLFGRPDGNTPWVGCNVVLFYAGKIVYITFNVSIIVDASGRTHIEIYCSSSQMAFDIRFKHKELILIDLLSLGTKSQRTNCCIYVGPGTEKTGF